VEITVIGYLQGAALAGSLTGGKQLPADVLSGWPVIDIKAGYFQF